MSKDPESNRQKSWQIIALIILLLASIIYIILTIFPDIPTIPKVVITVLTTGTAGLITLLIQQSIKFSVDRSLADHKKELQKEINEHQIKFSRLDEKRAEVIAKLNALLIAVQRDLIKLDNLTVDAIDRLTTPEAKNKYLNQTINDYQALFDYFDEHNLYLPEDLCKSIEKLLRVYDQTKMIHLFNRLFDQPNEKSISALMQSFDATRIVIPELREEIKQEFRQILGIDK